MKKKLKNQIINYIFSFKYIPLNIHKEGKQLVLIKILLNNLWYLDGHQK